ncbi:hypothetical protein [Rhizobium lentis]|uniref:hypothetical protein n=1 Tax=Rhizobium lentis TaxID=1138194 RepID=UPI001C83B997|nr:hypothetical protein [Rhizobium lentis]
MSAAEYTIATEACAMSVHSPCDGTFIGSTDVADASKIDELVTWDAVAPNSFRVTPQGITPQAFWTKRAASLKVVAMRLPG